MVLGILQKFPDTHTDWTHQTKLLRLFSFLFFSEEPSVSGFAQSGETICFTQPRLIWVCLQQPSWTLNMHLQRSRTGYPSGVSSFVRNGRCGRDRGLANTVGARGSSCTSVSWRKSTFGAGVCAEALSEKATESRLWAVLAPNMADHRETAVHAPVPSDYMSVCPQRMVATWPDLPKETNSHFLVCCWFV